MSKKELRIRRLFRDDGRAVYVPADRGIMDVLQRLINLKSNKIPPCELLIVASILGKLF